MLNIEGVRLVSNISFSATRNALSRDLRFAQSCIRINKQRIGLHVLQCKDIWSSKTKWNVTLYQHYIEVLLVLLISLFSLQPFMYCIKNRFKKNSIVFQPLFTILLPKAVLSGCKSYEQGDLCLHRLLRSALKEKTKSGRFTHVSFLNITSSLGQEENSTFSSNISLHLPMIKERNEILDITELLCSIETSRQMLPMQNLRYHNKLKAPLSILP